LVLVLVSVSVSVLALVQLRLILIAYKFRDKENRTKVKSFKKMPTPITASCFSKDGNVFAYASGYDWSQVCLIAIGY
jgi:hypothetical protein